MLATSDLAPLAHLADVGSASPASAPLHALGPFTAADALAGRLRLPVSPQQLVPGVDPLDFTSQRQRAAAALADGLAVLQELRRLIAADEVEFDTMVYDFGADLLGGTCLACGAWPSECHYQHDDDPDARGTEFWGSWDARDLVSAAVVFKLRTCFNLVGALAADDRLRERDVYAAAVEHLGVRLGPRLVGPLQLLRYWSPRS